jgi:hypothetical protein
VRRGLGAIAAVGLAACAQTAPPLPAPPPSIEGEWRVLAVNGRPTSGSARIAPPIFAIDFGCNSGRSGYRIERFALVPVGPMGTTERGCVTLQDAPTDAMRHEDEGFRIAHRRMQVTFYGPDRARLSNEAGTIDLARRQP